MWRDPENNGGRDDISYRIVCSRCPQDVVYSSIQPSGQGYEVNVSRLSSHTTYEFRVHSQNGVSSQSSVDNYAAVNATTFSSVPSAVRDLKVVEADTKDDSIKLRWRQPLFPNGEIMNYQVIYRTSAETQESVKYHYQAVLDGEVQETVVRRLEPGTDYVFKVAANTASGVGAYSQQVLATTSGSEPHSVSTVILAAAVSAIFIIVVLVAVVIFLVFWRRKSLNDLRQGLSNSQVSGPDANKVRWKAKQQLYYQISTVPPPRKKEVPPAENGHLIYANGTNGEVILPHIKKVKTYVDPFTYEDPNQAVKDFATEIDASQIRILDVIGGGEFGDVCSGLMLLPDKTTIKVAVKTLKTGATDKDRSDFLSEASIMGQFDHPNVIKLIGVVTRTRPAMIVTEFMENGSLDKYLKDNDGRFTVTQLLGMMRGIACGMRFLSEMNFVHRDLAARNILVNEHLMCKVADFGLSRRKELDGAYETRGGKIPIRWTAPEAIGYKKFTSASDVWSYGVVMWEIMSYGERPYWNWPNQDVIKAVEKGYRLPPPMECPEAIHQLMLDCWQRDRNHRPTFTTIVSTLERLIRNPNALRPLAKNGSPLGLSSSLNDLSRFNSVSDWLDSLKMGRYKDSFSQAGYVRLEDIARLSQSDLPRLGVTLAGHQKKIMKGIHSIRAQLEQAAETLV
ncbi:ephrin type-A receptor 4-like isoform X2 [Diadema antillarum]|uniref:ephrin type-A receptor 4-like isoform X2 n=1 Tax=Diadema antillarum TaxID=105358 RepID=UPI003A8AFC2C